MTRGLDTTLSNTLDDSLLVPVLFVELQFGSGTVYLHTDLGTITTLSQNWLGVGDLGSISAVEESSQIGANSISVSLSGLDSTILDQAVNQNYYERPARILVGVRDSATGALVSDPHELFYGKMDVMSVVSGQEGAVNLVLESELADFDKASMEYYSDAQLQRDFSGDLGFKYLAQVQNVSIIWGNKKATDVYGTGAATGKLGMAGFFRTALQNLT